MTLCRRRIRILLLCCTFLSVFILYSSARADSEAQSWNQFLSQGKLTRDLRLWAELQPRYSFDIGKFTTVLVRPGLGWQLTPDLSLWAGYAWTPQLNPASRNEHRVWAQGIHLADLGGISFTQRLRIETRLIESVPDSAVRLRYQARFTVPIALENTLHLVAYDEVFVSLNSAAPSIQSGFDQNRLFVGGFFRFSPQVAIDVGYLWNAVRRPQLADTRMNHVAMISLYLSFDLVKPLDSSDS